MTRIRTIKPSIARHELLFQVERETGFPIRFTWAALPMVCDREGRFKWRPASLKPDLLPYDAVDFGAVLDAFLSNGFIVRYRVGSEWFGWVPTFTKHQFINNREGESELPSVDEADEVIRFDTASSTCAPRVDDATQGEGKGRELEGKGNSSPTPRVAEPPSPSLVEFPTVGKGSKTWDFTEAHRADLQEAYPALDVLAEAKRARVWVLANGAKTAQGMPRFLVSWMNRATERSGQGRPSSSAGSAPVRMTVTPAVAARLRAAGVR